MHASMLARSCAGFRVAHGFPIWSLVSLVIAFIRKASLQNGDVVHGGVEQNGSAMVCETDVLAGNMYRANENMPRESHCHFRDGLHRSA